MPKKIMVIGGGIGGGTVTLALQKIGVQAEMFKYVSKSFSEKMLRENICFDAGNLE